MIDIGSSEAPAVLGVSPHTTPWQLWARKVGLLSEETEPNEIMRRGSQIERAVGEMFLSEVFDVKDFEEPAWSWSPDTRRWRQERPWQRATPDIVMWVNAPALVEIKCTVAQAPGVPRIDWIVQCLHQRLVYPEAERQYLVAFGGLNLEWWSIPKHQKALDRVLREEEKFLELVEKQIPPPVRAADASVLAKAWPITKAEPVVLGDDAMEHALALDRAMRCLKEWGTIKEENEAVIKAALGEHEEGVFPDGSRATWKSYERKGFTVEPSRARRFKRVGGKETGE